MPVQLGSNGTASAPSIDRYIARLFIRCALKPHVPALFATHKFAPACPPQLPSRLAEAGSAAEQTKILQRTFEPVATAHSLRIFARSRFAAASAAFSIGPGRLRDTSRASSKKKRLEDPGPSSSSGSGRFSSPSSSSDSAGLLLLSHGGRFGLGASSSSSSILSRSRRLRGG